jgi:hypothetical protein
MRPYDPGVGGTGKTPSSLELERAGIFNRLDEARIGLLDAEHWLRSWEAKAVELGRPAESPGYWDEGWRWINGELAIRRRSQS